MDLSTVRKIQLILFDLAKEVDALCRKHNITYWITSGTTLGAVRNGKFIPWDDDLDFCFLPDDFHKIRAIIKEDLLPANPHYILYNDHRPPTLGEYLADTNWVWDNFYPVKLDLIIVKSIPNTPEAIRKDRDYVNMLAFLYNKKDKLEVNSRELIHDALIQGGFWQRRERFMQKFNTYLYGLNEVRKDHIYSLDYSDTFAPRLKEYFTYDELFPVKEIELEGYKFFAPNNTNAFLTKLFGEDYMTPPPLEQRLPFHRSFRKALFPRLGKYVVRVMYSLKSFKNSFKLLSKVRSARKEFN